MWQTTYALLQRLLLAAIGHGGSPVTGPLWQVWVGLYQTGTPPVTPQSTMGSIVEATFDGYSRQQASWFPPFESAAGPELLVGQDLFFQPTGSVIPNTITGVFMADAFYGGTLLAGGIAPNGPINVFGPTSAIKIQPQFSLSTNLIYGAPAWVY